jgi:uncharacterized lipoprotein YmbA
MKCAPVFSLVALFAGSLLLMSGCASSPRSQFYTLTPVAHRSESPAAGTIPSVAIVSVTIPELVNRPQLVVRSDKAKVELLETHRWAEPLKDALSLTIAENISRLLASDKVSSYPQSVSLSADYKVYVDVRLFEFAGDHVELDALWSIRRADDRPAGNGRSRQREAVTAGGYGAVVAAFSRGVAGISRDIVQGLKIGWQAGQ